MGKDYLHAGRTELMKAGMQRWLDAGALRRNRRWRGAMYLAGYAVECALKVYLMEQHGMTHLSQLERKLGLRREQLLTHNLAALFELTGAQQRLANNPLQLRQALLCNLWSPHWRYQPQGGNERECSAFFEAVRGFLAFLNQRGAA